MFDHTILETINQCLKDKEDKMSDDFTEEFAAYMAEKLALKACELA